jgi:14-3-3 protein epsilon
MFERKKYNQSDYLFLTKLFQVSENYNDMIKAINKYIELNPKLSKDEKKLLSDAYKNIISDKRNSLHILLNLSQKEDSKQPNRAKEISIIKEKITTELKSIFQQVHFMLDKYLIPNAQDNESKIFYMKLKADFYRYHCEFALMDEFEEFSNKARELYKQALELAEKDLPLYNEIRLGLVLNYSVFEYDIMDNKNDAFDMASKIYGDIMKILDDVEKKRASENLLIVQMIKENINNWSNEIEED